jgi:hypothetical protein
MIQLFLGLGIFSPVGSEVAARGAAVWELAGAGAAEARAVLRAAGI